MVTRNVFIGESEETLFQGQLNLTTARFETGRVEHTLVTGLEAAQETSSPTFGFGTGVPGTDLLNPARGEAFSATGTALRLAADTVGDSTAIYALDTMKFNERWQLIAGLRWDRFAADYEATRFSTEGAVTGVEATERTDEEASYRARGRL